MKAGTLVTRPSLARPKGARHGIIREVKGHYSIVKFWGTHIPQRILTSQLVLTDR